MEQPSAAPLKIDRLQPKHPQGLVVVITGNGKGKTTSAMGMVLRASGHGLRSCIVQFMKGNLYSGEWDGVKRLGDLVELHTAGRGFCGIRGDRVSRDEHRGYAQAAIALALEKMLSGGYDLVLLDEINNAVHHGLVDLAQLLALLDARPAMLHLILTGRNAAPAVIERADTVSEVNEIKHAYRQQIEPQPGIDY